MEMPSFSLEWWSPNLGASESHEDLLQHKLLGPTLRVSSLVGVGLAFVIHFLDADLICQG